MTEDQIMMSEFGQIGTGYENNMFNTTDGNPARNLGGSYFLIDSDQIVPEPATLGFAAVSFGVLFAVRRKLRLSYG